MLNNKNAANLALIALLLVSLGCSCSKLVELGRKNSDAPPRSEKPVNTGVNTKTDDREVPDLRKGDYDLTMEMYNRVKVGMSRQEAEEILGGQGTEMSSSKGGGMSFSVNKWDGDNFKAIILSFKNEKVMTKSQVGLK